MEVNVVKVMYINNIILLEVVELVGYPMVKMHNKMYKIELWVENLKQMDLKVVFLNLQLIIMVDLVEVVLVLDLIQVVVVVVVTLVVMVVMYIINKMDISLDKEVVHLIQD
jgi:hypothetical protein